MPEIHETFTVSKDNEGVRIDKLLSGLYPEKSRNSIQKYIVDGNIVVNNSSIKSNYKCHEGDIIKFDEPLPTDVKIEAEDIPLDIIYEDEDVLIVNKPKGMVVHPAAGHYSGTLVNAIMYHCRDDLSGINGEIRPGIVHRIDMDTTGSLIVCKNDIAHNKIAAQIKEHSINRVYRGIVVGNISEDDGVIDAPIGRSPSDRKKMAVNVKNGKAAVTHYKVLQRFGKYTYMEFKLETGRTHQIRVHMSSLGHPILGDSVYGSGKSPFKLNGQTLHAYTIGFIHPSTNQYVEFKAPLPEYFEHLLKIL